MSERQIRLREEFNPRLKIEFGGGKTPRGEGFINVDKLDSADVVHDLNETPYPFKDQSAEAIYSSHCIEHLTGYIPFLRECARIGRLGAHVELRAPDAMSEMAMCPGHKHVFSMSVVFHMDHVFPEVFWSDSERRLKLIRIVAGPDPEWFHKARSNPLFADWTDEDIMTWLPRTRHENQFHLQVVKNDV